MGVNAFFVLSGFLITSLLLREYGRSGRIALGRFYLRRVIRLFPPLLAVIVAVTLYSLFVPGAVRSEESLTGTLPAFFYFSNWVRAFTEDATPLGLYEHTWSLSVEEQFYILWPLVLWAVLRITRRLWAVVVVSLIGCMGSLMVRFVVEPGVDGARIYNGFDTEADQLLFGCALAALILWAEMGSWGHRLGRGLAWALLPAVGVIAVAAFTWDSGHSSARAFVSMTVIAVAFAVTVGTLYLNPQNPLSRVLATKPFVYIGKRSYALYLWHYPIFTVMQMTLVPSNGPLRMAIQFALSLLAAELSWRLIEVPSGRLKDRLTGGKKASAPNGVHLIG